jgi:cyclopropane fatty-acyl-phospholipid synthase-like methyltransferase
MHKQLQPAPFIKRNIGHLRGHEPILEIGCGTGRNALHLGRQGLTVVGIDVDESSIDQASAYASAEEKVVADRVTFRVADVRKGLDGSFGAVVCTEVLQDISREDWGVVFRSIMEATQIGGLNLVSGYVSEYPEIGRGKAFIPGELEYIYGGTGWETIAATTSPTSIQEYGGKIALTSLSQIVAIKLR